MYFRVEESFWKLFPDALIGVAIARGVDNRTPRPDLADELAVAIEQTAARLAGAEMAGHPDVAPWRQAYAAFGAKPSKFRSSIEALLRSAQSGRLRGISPLVDLYNIVSLRHALPCGGEDLAAMQGDLRLTRAAGGEAFTLIGAAEPDPPAPGEVIYRDDIGVVCRCWNWREAERTKLTEATADAFLCIEALPSHGEARLRAALDELADGVRRSLGGHVTTDVLRRGHAGLKIE
jgi:DNA/RNA-binding domain of Phe-tRNA-synthetase-like protein